MYAKENVGNVSVGKDGNEDIYRKTERNNHGTIICL